MKTIELLGSSDVVALITRVSDSQAYRMVDEGKAKYVPKSQWKVIRDARKEIEDRKLKELKARQAAEAKPAQENQKDRKHFKKGKPNGNRTGKGQAGSDNQTKQRVPGQDRKAGSDNQTKQRVPGQDRKAG